MLETVMIMGFLACISACVGAFYMRKEAIEANTAAEKMLRMANERLYESEQIWQRTRKFAAQPETKQVKDAKVLKFERPLKSVPPDNNDGPKVA